MKGARDGPDRVSAQRRIIVSRVRLNRHAMSGIKKDPAVTSHFARNSLETKFIKALAKEFTVTWADRRYPANATLSVYLLRPDKPMVELFGFAQEVLAVYSPFRELQARVFQGVDMLLGELPFSGRADPTTCLVVTDDPAANEKTLEYAAANPGARTFVGICRDELERDRTGWALKNRMMQRLFAIDLFDHRLPLKNDASFFGRNDVVADFQRAFTSGENRGLFGLRKTGKTSIIYKCQRLAEKNGSLSYLYFDCKSPSIRMLRWPKLLQKIGSDIARLTGQRLQPEAVDEIPGAIVAQAFLDIVARVPTSQTPVIVFDEIEYISPLTRLDEHWDDDFIPFWQTIWSAQSAHRLPVLIVGVNPSIVELDRIASAQNPLFGIVPPRFLTGLAESDLQRMLTVLGARMGLRFDHSAARYMQERYGGHPLLVRLACSLLHRSLQSRKVERPFEISRSELLAGQDVRDGELVFYCGHVLSELRDFYPEEYNLLENIATGQMAEFLDFYKHPEYVQHLLSYGLLRRAPGGVQAIAIPVVGDYVGMRAARNEGRLAILRLVPHGERNRWLDRRVRSLMDDIRRLEALIRRPSLSKRPLLFGANSFPEAEKFATIEVVSDESSFSVFVNAMNRCFVESIERQGLDVGKKNYFWEDIKVAYPDLQHALNRVKVYRHHRVHLALNPCMDKILTDFLRRDLEDRKPTEIDELWFTLQQCVLDNLFLAVQAELERLE